MDTFFNINYEFDKAEVHRRIANADKGYICVADGVVMNTANRDPNYLRVINESLFSICDSSWVPVYLKSIYGVKYEQYCGYDILKDIVISRKYRMMFLGANQSTLDALRKELAIMNSDVENMQFIELPFCDVEDFDYRGIARVIDDDGAKIIWVALGAPKQERFMNMILPYINHGILIGVGAAFKFLSRKEESRCPTWMQQWHLEFIYRILKDPKKQLKRCFWIVWTLPGLYFSEIKRAKRALRAKKNNDDPITALEK